MNEGLNNLNILSNLNEKSFFLKLSSLNYSDKVFNSSHTYFTPDFLPVIGKSTKYNNLFYNFGVNSHML